MSNYRKMKIVLLVASAASGYFFGCMLDSINESNGHSKAGLVFSIPSLILSLLTVICSTFYCIRIDIKTLSSDSVGNSDSQEG